MCMNVICIIVIIISSSSNNTNKGPDGTKQTRTKVSNINDNH